MKKLEWYNLKACKEIRVQILIAAGFNLKTDYFRLDSRKLSYCFGGAAWAESITEPRPITANDILAAAVIKKILRY